MSVRVAKKQLLQRLTPMASRRATIKVLLRHT